MHLHGHYETNTGYACARCGWELSKEDIYSNPKTKEILEALGSDYDENGVPYWDKYEKDN